MRWYFEFDDFYYGEYIEFWEELWFIDIGYRFVVNIYFTEWWSNGDDDVFKCFE